MSGTLCTSWKLLCHKSQISNIDNVILIYICSRIKSHLTTPLIKRCFYNVIPGISLNLF